MKGVCLCVGLSLFSGAGYAQSDTLTLPSLSKNRAAYFERQQALVKTYLTTNNRAPSFTDEKGNRVRLVGITPSGRPVYFTTLNAGAAITTGVVQLQTGGSLGLNFQGEGMLIGVWDGGKVKDHVELDQRVVAKEGTTFDTHATHVSGTLIASGINSAARGMAPQARASTHDFDNDEAEMAALAKPDQTSLLFSNHSYGTATGWFKNNGVWEWTGDAGINALEDYRFGFYGSRAQTIDQIAWLAPYYTIVWATGNDRGDVGDGSKPVDCNGGSGYDCIIPEAVSKNIISVGAVNKVLSYSNPFDVSMSTFSSWGPTDDGRIKPDLAAAGVNLFSLSAAGSNTYTTLSGTSMATPNVSGSLLLLQEIYAKIHGGDFMRSATVKALAIHTAREAGNFPGPDYSFGWGLLDAAAAGKTLVSQDGKSSIVRELTLENGEAFTMILDPKANQKITATLAWTDPPGDTLSPSLDPAKLSLVNDLDLRIVDEEGREQLPWTLDPTNPSQRAVLADNFRDNIEKLEFNNPEGKNYTLTVRHKGTLRNGKQDFSLIVTYLSASAAKIFYWIGNAGNWSDGNHWSLSSGGPPSLLIPGPGDKIIIDENSFDGSGSSTISLTQDASCATLLWINSKPSGISLNNTTLSLAAQLIVASRDFSILTPGTLRFQAGPLPGNLFAWNGNLKGATLVFDGGTWNLKGKMDVDEVRINAGNLNIAGSTLSAMRLTSQSAVTKSLNLDHTIINLSASSNIDGNALTVTSDHASIGVDAANVLLQWDNVNFPGTMQIGPGANLTAHGNNRIGRISTRGRLSLTGSNQIDTLVVEAGAGIDFGPSTVQTLSSQTTLNGTAAQPVTLSSTGNSSLLFGDHVKLCFDFLEISHVAIEGSAVVNAGMHSTLSNATHWEQLDCGDVLFSDFTLSDNCAGSLAEFASSSSGNIVAYAWQFGGDGGESHDPGPVWKFEQTGNYPVTLEVSDNSSTNSVTKQIDIVANTLPANQIISNGSALTSMISAQRFQWFRNGLLLPGATDRALALGGSDGAYYVIAYDAHCNISSDTVTVTGLDDPGDLQIFPNPASELIKVKFPEKDYGTLSLTDLLGRSYIVRAIGEPEIQLSTEGIPAGIYILQIELTRMKTRRKIAILH